MKVYILHQCFDNLQDYDCHCDSDVIRNLYSTYEKAKAEMDMLSRPTSLDEIAKGLEDEKKNFSFSFRVKELPAAPQFDSYRYNALSTCDVTLYQVTQEYWEEDDEDDEFQPGWQWDVYDTCQYGWYIQEMEVL